MFEDFSFEVTLSKDIRSSKKFFFSNKMTAER